MRRIRTAALLVAALAAGACDTAAPPSGAGLRSAVPAPDRDSAVIFVSLDTFRADAAGCGGDPLALTPHLDRAARSGLQFTPGLAPVPLTLPSHTSMLTGLDPPAHGVRDNGTFRLGEGIPTLAEFLRDRGFETAAFLAAFPLDKRFGLDRGFDVYDDEVSDRGALGMFATDQRPGIAVNEAAAAWFAGRSGSRRAFAWVHLFDAHTPWTAPAPLRIAAGGDPYRGDVALADRALGRTMRLAEERGNTWVVMFGDHGESLGNHKEAKHGLFIYEATTRVPAAVWPRPADAASGLKRGPFRAIDVPATILDLIGLDPAEAPGSGASGLRRTGPAYLESYYSYYHYGWAPLRALNDGRWKYIDAPEPELYDLRSDPGERNNIAADHPDRVAEMAEELAGRASRTVEAESLELDEAAREALESLGYVTAETAPAPEEADLRDPKRMLAVQRLIEQAQARISAGETDAGLRALRSALSRDPRNKDIYQTLAMTYALGQRWAEAVDAYVRCLELPPHQNDRVPRFELATAYIKLGRYEQAVRELETILLEVGNDAATAFNLGVALDALGRTEEAREAWKRALEADPDHELARNALGR